MNEENPAGRSSGDADAPGTSPASSGSAGATPDAAAIEQVLAQAERSRRVLLSVVEDQKRAETALRESEERQRMFIEHAPAALAMFDREMRYLAASRRWMEDYALGNRDIRGVSHFEFFPNLAERWREIYLRGLAGEVIRDDADHFTRTDGRVQWLRWEVRPWHTIEGRVGGIMIFSEDITARRESEERFRQIAENIHEVFWVRDVVTDELLYVSPAYETIWGRTCASLHANPAGWLDAIHPDDRERVGRAIATRSDGNYTEVYRVIRPDGGERWVADIAYPVRDEKGAVTRLVGTAEDVTKSRELEQQLRQAQKVEAIGTLAGGIAHDFNNILAAQFGFTELARMRAADRPDILEPLSDVETSGRRAAELVRQILTFSRQQKPERKIVRLQPVIGDALRLLRATIPSSIAIDASLADGAACVLADVTQIHQIVINLCTNAWHAINTRSGRIEVRLENVECRAPLVALNARRPAGSYVRLSVRDSGHGMDEATLARIFDPFFTTKNPGRGTGLGLSVVHGIAQDHDGAIVVRSQPGVGSVFELYFPASDGELTTAPAVASHSDRATGRGERIALVDDESAILRITQRLFEKLGYRVATFAAGGDILAALREAPDQFQLVITDQTMPGMSGLELAATVRELGVNVPVILTTGYLGDFGPDELKAAGIRSVLLKPLDLSHLAAAVRDALDHNPAS